MVHHLDIGAMNMGTRGWNTEIFQEGVSIPPMKLIGEGRLDPKVMSIILPNTRTPGITTNDVASQVRREQAYATDVLGLLEQYGLDRDSRSAACEGRVGMVR